MSWIVANWPAAGGSCGAILLAVVCAFNQGRKVGAKEQQERHNRTQRTISRSLGVQMPLPVDDERPRAKLKQGVIPRRIQ